MPELVQQIVQEFNQGKTSCSWIICGPKGIGKKSLVSQVAQNLLGSTPSHLLMGLKWVECGLTEDAKKTLQKVIQTGDIIPQESEFEKKSEITIDELRSGLNFISLKSTLPCKILAISLAEEMNENTQNALLKTLEEPFEKTLIFLLSENQNKLLPTILSRCKQIVMHTLTDDEMRQQISKDYPTCEDVSLVVKLSDGMPGIARMICENQGLKLYNDFLSFLCPVENLNILELSDFLQTKNKAERTLLSHYILKFLYQQGQTNNLEQANHLSLLYSWAESQFLKTKSLYLDDKQVLLNIFLKIAENLK